MSKHDEAVRFAELNRELIAKRFLEAIRASGERSLDINHNLVSAKNINGCDSESGYTEKVQHRVIKVM